MGRTAQTADSSQEILQKRERKSEREIDTKADVGDNGRKGLCHKTHKLEMKDRWKRQGVASGSFQKKESYDIWTC